MSTLCLLWKHCCMWRDLPGLSQRRSDMVDLITGFITNWSWILHNKRFFSLWYDWTRLWILIWEVGPLSVKAKRVCLLGSRNRLVTTPSILISKGQPCPPSSGPSPPVTTGRWNTIKSRLRNKATQTKVIIFKIKLKTWEGTTAPVWHGGIIMPLGHCYNIQKQQITIK